MPRFSRRPDASCQRFGGWHWWPVYQYLLEVRTLVDKTPGPPALLHAAPNEPIGHLGLRMFLIVHSHERHFGKGIAEAVGWHWWFVHKFHPLARTLVDKPPVLPAALFAAVSRRSDRKFGSACQISRPQALKRGSRRPAGVKFSFSRQVRRRTGLSSSELSIVS
jgi:hypothetical protein